ncbi:malate/L-lactate dehydrogenase-like protein [Westerdykella ornata]|uniref:Malate/L-lactate dehydrogenase-like protein n=1 Tax=Westerdykella ornata TaxID=318751 RepID=A0A6A6JEB2_WESOR|nr:malate/L-lactate dehydrogenase-like protein [Westerdykella ornata]KAF2274752.1 malate/L-lactate dehydrogenase-like protein [Westerdykella ornata]
MPSSYHLLLVPPSTAHRFAVDLLTHNGVASTDAAIIASALVEADLRGHDTHGIQRLPSYIARIRHGVLDPHASPTLKQITPVVALVDGHNGFGFLAAHMGMDAAIRMAQGEMGIGLVAVKHSNHFGMSAWVVQQALDAGMASLVFTNSSPALPPYGGREKLLGVSPIAAGAPGGPGRRPYIIDMAPSVAARGKVYKALRRGEQIPKGWALDKHGRETQDPQAALEGVMLAMGGPKGSALAIMMDVFSGVLTGSAFAGNVAGPYDPSRPGDVGHFLLAIRPDLFLSRQEFAARMQYLYERVTGAERAEGVDRIYFPGEVELVTRERRMREGIPVVQAELDALNEEAKRVGVDLLTAELQREKARL